ncbi:hypothetical protein D3C86_2213970 [compost metagenome]
MRPITKKLLQRLDLLALFDRLGPDVCLEGINRVLTELGQPTFDRPSAAWRDLLSRHATPALPHGR